MIEDAPVYGAGVKYPKEAVEQEEPFLSRRWWIAITIVHQWKCGTDAAAIT